MSLKSTNNLSIVTHPLSSVMCSNASGSTRSTRGRPPPSSDSPAAAFTRWPPLKHRARPKTVLPLVAWGFRRRSRHRLAATRHRPAQKTAGLHAPVSLQLCRFRSPPPARLPTRPRPGPPLGTGQQTRPCRPAQTHPGTRTPLATRSNRRTLATGCLASPLVSSLQAFLPHAQHAG